MKTRIAPRRVAPKAGVAYEKLNLILIAGCKQNQTSADVMSSNGGAYGALTNALEETVKQFARENRLRELTNRALVLGARDRLKTMTQIPCLECSMADSNIPFIAPV